MPMSDDDWDDVVTALDEHDAVSVWARRCDMLRHEVLNRDLQIQSISSRDADDPTEVELLREQLQAKREECGRLQTENETLRAAAQTHEPVGWLVCVGPLTGFRATCDIDGPVIPAMRNMSDGRARRVYLGPAEPIPEQPNA